MTPEMIKKEPLASILEIANKKRGYLQMNEKVKNAKN